MMNRDEMLRQLSAAANIGWLDGFAAVLWTLVGDQLSDETVAEYEARVARLSEVAGIEKVNEWKL